MSEKAVENAVIKHFRKAGFSCLPDRTRGWKRFSVADGRTWEPDVVAFKWDEDGTVLDIIGVECKKNGTNATIMSALEQIKSYQKHFPWCYIATTKSNGARKADYEFLRKHHNVGYMPIDTKKRPVSTIATKILDTYPDCINHNLSLIFADSARQKLVMLDTFSDRFRNIAYHFRGGFGWIWTIGDVQYQVTNYNLQQSVQFGINIENRKVIEDKVKGRLSLLATVLQDPGLEEFRIVFRRKEYLKSRPRAAVSSTIIQKACLEFSVDDADQLEAILEKYDYHIQLLIQKTIWNRDDVLFRQDYVDRIGEAKSLVDGIKKAIKW